MYDVNRVMLMGRVGSTPVRRETKKGVAVTHFSLATNRRIRDAEGAELEPGDERGGRNAKSDDDGGETAGSGASEKTSWHRVVAWGRQAEYCAQQLKTGHTVFVEGSVRPRKYEAKTGETRTSFEVHADIVSNLGRRRFEAEDGGEGVAVTAAEVGAQVH